MSRAHFGPRFVYSVVSRTNPEGRQCHQTAFVFALKPTRTNYSSNGIDAEYYIGTYTAVDRYECGVGRVYSVDLGRVTYGTG